MYQATASGPVPTGSTWKEEEIRGGCEPVLERAGTIVMMTETPKIRFVSQGGEHLSATLRALNQQPNWVIKVAVLVFLVVVGIPILLLLLLIPPSAPSLRRFAAGDASPDASPCVVPPGRPFSRPEYRPTSTCQPDLLSAVSLCELCDLYKSPFTERCRHAYAHP